MDKLLEGFVAIILGVLVLAFSVLVGAAITVPLVLLSAYIGQDLWAMYILPLCGVPVPSIWIMAGLMVVVRFFKGVEFPKEEDKDKNKKKSETPMWDAAKPFVFQLLFLLIMWGEANLCFWLAS